MLLEVWLLILLGGTTDSILACQSVPGGQRDMWLHHYPITPPLWRQTQPGLISGRVRIEAAALAHPSHTLALLGDQTPPQAKKKGKEKKNQIKYGFVLYSFSASLADLRFPQGKGSLFLCTVPGLDESFQIFCWMWESDCLGNYLCEKIS